jgi:hypothetical protein
MRPGQGTGWPQQGRVMGCPAGDLWQAADVVSRPHEDACAYARVP